MRPPTPAMIRALRLIELHGQLGKHHLRADTRTALQRRGLIESATETREACYCGLITCRCCCELTDAGRRVLREQGQQ